MEFLDFFKRNKLIWEVTILILLSAFITGKLQNLVCYEDPEKAYEHAKRDKAVLVIDGDTTSYVVGEDDSIILEKDENGWRIPSVEVTKSKGWTINKTILIGIVSHKSTNEWYIAITEVAGNSLEISDNRNTKFDVVKRAGESGKTYYAYIPGLDDDYVLYINDQEIRLE